MTGVYALGAELSTASYRLQWVRTGSSLSFFKPVFLAEFFDPPFGVDDFLLARVERMTDGTNFHVQIASQAGARNERVTA